MCQIKLFSLLLVIVLSVVLSILPSKGLDHVLLSIADFFSLGSVLLQYSSLEVTNIGHSLAMFVITLMAFSVFPGRVFLILTIAITVSVGLECLQYFVPTRTVSLQDLLYDVVGIVAAWMFYLLSRLVWRVLVSPVRPVNVQAAKQVNI